VAGEPQAARTSVNTLIKQKAMNIGRFRRDVSFISLSSVVY
jgi:hypothetical protein